MNNERRHELQQNELAEQLEKAKTWIEPYLVPILSGVVIVTIVGMGYNFFQTRSVGERSDATLELLFAGGQAGEAGDAEAFQSVAKRFANLSAAEVAKLSQADVLLGRGIEALYRDRQEAEGLIGDAVAAYEEVAKATSNTLMKSRASFGLAQASESLGELDAARDAYQQVIDLSESEAMVRVAEQRLQTLGSEGVQAFVTWFGEQEPTSSAGGSIPGLPSQSDVPGSPDFTFPNVSPTGDAGEAGTEAATEGEPATGEESMNEESTIESDAKIPPVGEAGATEEPGAAEGAPVVVPPANEPATEGKPAEGTTAEVPPVEEPATEKPTTEKPTTEEPAAGEPATEEPATSEPSGGEPSGGAGEEPAAEKPASEGGTGTEGTGTEGTGTEGGGEDPAGTERESL